MQKGPFNWNSIELPKEVIAGQSFIISVDVSAIEALFDNGDRMMFDSNNDIILPKNSEYTSIYSGEEIDKFIKEVLS